MELSDRYQPQEVEKRVYEWWDSQGYFKAEDLSVKPPFSVILPPPNVTGSLHLGHALDHSIQDVIVRWKRMSGFNTLWLPGTDHAGIATQTVVEKSLKKEGIKRQDLGREAFVEKVWDWKHQYGNRIVEQMKRLGDSCDWDRICFTLDEGVSLAVRKVFVALFEKGLIYRGSRLINWSPALESAISDLEVEFKEVKGNLWHIAYPISDGAGELVVATTRPETLLGDVAVAVHPEDERYKKWIGSTVKLPLTLREIPIIADASVDKEFGSGAVKITPAHDFNDYAMGERHKLEQINILTKDGKLNEQTGQFQGLSVKEARKKVVDALTEQGLLRATEPHTHQVGHCSRTGCVVEPLLSEQWFVRMKTLADPAKRVVESGTIQFEPEHWTKTYLHWMNNIEDWCISRQLWWGHRIPAWNCSDCGKVTVSENAIVEACQHCGSNKVVQDEDVLDTWFSSQLWPFSTMGWPEETESLKTFYPTNLLVTGHDIIFFWVARMVMAGLEFKQDVPFRLVYIHGLVRDAQGRKMSKSEGNAQDPLELIDQFGADALRMALMSSLNAGRDLKFSMQRLEGYRNYMNKIWNATRFSLKVLEGFQVSDQTECPSKTHLSLADQWIIDKLARCEKEVDQALSQMRFAEAVQAIYNFTWREFCDWYLEFLKPIMSDVDSEEKKASQFVLSHVLNRWVRLLHPFAPFISEEIYQKLPIRSKACIVANYPKPQDFKEFFNLGSEKSALEIDLIREVITAVRNIRGENRISPAVKLKVIVSPQDDNTQKILGENRSSIMSLAGVGELLIENPESMSRCAVQPIVMGGFQADVVIPLEGLVDIEEEMQRLRKTIEKKQKESLALSKRLSNQEFLKNAPEEIVQNGKLQLQELSSEMKSLQDALQKLI